MMLFRLGTGESRLTAQEVTNILTEAQVDYARLRIIQRWMENPTSHPCDTPYGKLTVVQVKLVYTVQECQDGKTFTQTFEGFQRCSNISFVPDGCEYLGIAQVEGSIEVWWLENRFQAVEELQRLYRMEWDRDIPIRVFRSVSA